MENEVIVSALPKRPWYKRTWGIILILFLSLFLLSAIWFGWLVYHNVQLIKTGKLKPVQDFSQEFSAGKITNGVPTGKAPLTLPTSQTTGDEKSAVTIVEFADFECPFCQKEFPIIRTLMHNTPGVKFVFRDYPLIEIHPHAMRAAEAARCAAEQKKFWEYHDQLYLNQQDLSDEALLKYANVVGLQSDQFSKCLKSEKYKLDIQRDMQDGAALGVHGTPTFFITTPKATSGVKIEGVVPAEAWQTILNYISK